VAPVQAVAPAAAERAVPEDVAPTPEPAAEAAGDESRSTSKRSHHRHRSSRKQAQEDRVARGLSIDPFAEAQRAAKP
jgi:hypothetical protein